MSETGWFVAGMVVAVGGIYLTAKLLKPTIKDKLSTIAAHRIVIAAQGAGLGSIVPPEQNLKALVVPAIDDALREVWV